MKIASRHISHLLFLIGLFVMAPFAMANPVYIQDSPTITAIGSESLKVDPGSVVTLIYKIEPGSTAAEETYQPVITLPEGWDTFFGNEPLTLKDGKSTIRKVVIKVPQATMADAYTVGFSLENQQNQQMATHSLSLQVNTRFELVIATDFSEAFVPAGKSIPTQIFVSNRGNSTIEVDLKVVTRSYTSVEIEKQLVKLNPGQAETVAVLINTDARLDHSAKAGLRLEATSRQDADQTVIKTLSFEIVPVYSRVKAIAAGIPVSLGISTIGNENGVTPQAQIATGFDALGGSIAVNAILSEQPRRKFYQADQMLSVKYKSKSLGVQLGDHSQSLSPLTMNGEFGQGASVSYEKNDWTVVSTVQKTKLSFPVQNRAGISVTKKLSDTSFASLNVLQRSGLYSGGVMTLRSVSQPLGPTSRLDAECGITSDSALSDPTCSLAGSKGFTNWSIRIKAQTASQSYPGTLAGVRQYSQTLNYRINQSIRLDNSFSILKRSLGTGNSRSNVYSKTGITYSNRIFGGTFVTSLDGIHSNTSYESLFESVSRQELVAKATSGFHTRATGVSVSYEIGRIGAEGDTPSSRFSRFKTTARRTIRNGWSVNGSYETSSGSLSALKLNQKQQMVGLGTSFQLPKGIAVSSTGFMSRIVSNTLQSYLSVQTRVSKTFNSGHLLRFQAQHSQSDGRVAVSSTDYMLSYTAPINLPFAKGDQESTILKGQIIDLSTGEPIPDVLLFLGESISLSDKDGFFALPRKLDRSEFLRLDQRSIGYSKVTTKAFPLELAPTDFQGTDLVITVSPAAEVSGHVSVFSHEGTQSKLFGNTSDRLVKVGGLQLAVVEISSETHQFRTRTDENGYFRFSQLSSGSYTTRIVSANILAHQRLAPGSIDVKAEAGKSNTVEFEVVPVKKQLRIIKSSSLSIKEAPRAAAAPTTTPSKQSFDSEKDKDSAHLYEGHSSGRELGSERGLQGKNQDWRAQLKESAVQKSAFRRGGLVTVPFYLNVRPNSNTEVYSRPFYVLMLILSVLFFLTAIEAVIRQHSERQESQILQISKPGWIWAYRQTSAYVVLVTAMCVLLGPLGGLSTALCLAGISVSIESSEQYKNMLAIAYLTLLRGLKPGIWIQYQQAVAKIERVGIHTVFLKLQNGKLISLTPWALSKLSIVRSKPQSVRSETIEIVVARTSNLRSIRMIASDICALHAPDGAPKNVYIEFTDLDAIQTRVTIKTVIQDQSLSSTELADALNLALREFGPVTESTVQTYPGLRLIKSSGDKAA